MKIFKKLIRDNMPEIMEAQGKHLVTRVLSEEEYIPALENKLLEEVQELRTDPAESKMEKMAYIYEILDTLRDALRITQETIMEEREKKLAERGGFSKRLFLESAEDK